MKRISYITVIIFFAGLFVDFAIVISMMFNPNICLRYLENAINGQFQAKYIVPVIIFCILNLFLGIYLLFYDEAKKYKVNKLG